MPLGEYGIADRAYEINVGRRRASPARWPTRYRRRPSARSWPARSVPARSSPTLGQIRFADLRDTYEVQAAGLLDGGVDLLLVETQFDLLGAQGRR